MHTFAGKRHGMPTPPLLGEVARRSRDGEVVQSSTCVLRSLERRPLFNLSDACGDSRSPFGTCVPPPPAGGVFPTRRALGKEVSFSMKPICVCRKTSRNAKASPTRGGGIERSEDDGEVVQSSTCVIPLTLKASFVQPLRRWRASSPKVGALGKEVSFSMKLIGACWKTRRNAKASHFGRGVCGADGEGKDAAKEPDTQRYAPCLSEPSYRNAAGVISPGLPSQALTRQLPQNGSPWQRGSFC